MVDELAWKVGGQQGEGIESTGELFSLVMNRLGYHLYGYRQFSSRIKGGHTNNKLRVALAPVQAIPDAVDVLVALDQETIDLNLAGLRPGGVVIAESAVAPVLPEGANATLLAIPFSATAAELGAPVMKNTVATGASLALLGIDLALADGVVRELFRRKGETVVNGNLAALRRGGELVAALLAGARDDLHLAPSDGRRRHLLIGNEAIALGAIAAGCRFMAAYPITPASEIMEYLIKKLPELGGAVIQTEDEIAACTMAIGANFAGARAFTASSGPGLSLMVEAIGLAGMTETPLVVVDTQRGGPSTGLPTKHEQSDLLAMIHASHGEIPKIVLAPSTAEEAFYDMVEAFNLAEEYQCPVILLSDLQLSLAKQTVETLDYDRIEIRRGKLDLAVDRPEQPNHEPCKRFAVTEDGISPRLLPGLKDGVFIATGLEHDERGRPAEAPANRKAQMEKRLRKVQGMTIAAPVIVDCRDGDDELLLIGFNATRGAIAEATARLRSAGVKAAQLHLRQLHPFPTASVAPLIARFKRIVVVEHNATGQLAQILRSHCGAGERIVSLLKYDGNPLAPGEIAAQAGKVVRDEQR